MSAELEVLLTNKKWQKVLAAILDRYEQLARLVCKARELEITVTAPKGLYCYCWVHPYQLIFSKYVRKRRRYPPWTIKTVSEDILIYKCTDITDPSWRKHGELRLENNLTEEPWYIDVIWVDLESLGSITSIAEWLQEVCKRYEEVIGDRESELQVSDEYFDSLADMAGR